jgi:Tol biopolymer transport system component
MRTRVGLAATVLGALIAGFAPVAEAAPNDTTLQGRDTGSPGVKQNSSSVDASVISADGRYIAFTSSATNLAGGFTGFYVYLRNTQTNTTTLVSRADGVAGNPANAFAAKPSISADGRFVAFESAASNLGVANPSSNIWVYVRDTVNNTTTLVSRADGAAGDPPDADAGVAAISGDGGSVAFRSTATNLDDDADGTQHVFVRDLTLNETVLASRADGAAGSPGNNTSNAPSLSADGTLVAFESNATNLHPADSSGTVSVFVRNVANDTTGLVSRADGASGANANNVAFDASISGDGDRIAFASLGTNLDASDTDITRDIYVRDRSASDTSLASVSDLGAPGDGNEGQPEISADGRTVVFESGSSNLYPGFDGHFDIAMRDMQAEQTHLVSRAGGASGVIGNDSSRVSSVSADGTRVAFTSEATNLHPDDTDADVDVYMRETDIDVTAPTASIDSGPPNRGADDTPTFTFSSADIDFASFQCFVDDTAVACSGSGTHTTTQLDNGSHIFAVRATDASGNVGDAVEDNFSVDTTGPETQVTSAPPATTADNTPTIAFGSAADDVASFQCALDAGAFAACTSPVTTSALANGPHTFKIRGLDDLGNQGAVEEVAFTVAQTPPDGEVDDPRVELPPKITAKGKELKAVVTAGAGENVSAAATAAVVVDSKRGEKRTELAPVTGQATAGDDVELTLRYRGSAGKRKKATKKLITALRQGAKATLSVEVELTDQAGNSVTEERSAKLKVKKAK